MPTTHTVKSSLETVPYLHYLTFDDARTTAEFTYGITLAMAPFLGVVAAEPAGREALRVSVGPTWAAEGPATLHLTLNPVVGPGPRDGEAVARSVLIIDPAQPPAIRLLR